MLKIAYGGVNWFITPLVLGILAITLAEPLGQPWLVTVSPIFLSLALALLWFFRDPARSIGEGIVSGADGKVVRMDEVDDEDLGPCDRLSVFMSPLDVHVNRAPFAGSTRRVKHVPGKHLPAFSKDSDRNERVICTMKTEHGDAKLIMIAGAVARRIVPYLEPGDHVQTGERIALIRLGSRFDILVPKGTVKWTVAMGDRVKAGTSQVGQWN